MAYTVQDAIAAVVAKQTTLTPDKIAYINASITIKDGGSDPITGGGPLYRTIGLLGNLDPYAIWDVSTKFGMKRGTTGQPFLLGMNIEPLITIIGPMIVRPPAFITPFLQRHGLLFRKAYLGAFGLYLQPQFSVVLNENQASPRLTGTLTSPAAPGVIVPPASFEIVLESVAARDLIG